MFICGFVSVGATPFFFTHPLPLLWEKTFAFSVHHDLLAHGVVEWRDCDKHIFTWPPWVSGLIWKPLPVQVVTSLHQCCRSQTFTMAVPVPLFFCRWAGKPLLICQTGMQQDLFYSFPLRHHATLKTQYLFNLRFSRLKHNSTSEWCA